MIYVLLNVQQVAEEENVLTMAPAYVIKVTFIHLEPNTFVCWNVIEYVNLQFSATKPSDFRWDNKCNYFIIILFFRGICVHNSICACQPGAIKTKLNGHCLEAWADECYGTCNIGTCSSCGCCTCPQGYKRNPDFSIITLGYLENIDWKSKYNMHQQCVPDCDGIIGPLDADCVLPNLYSCSLNFWHYNHLQLECL